MSTYRARRGRTPNYLSAVVCLALCAGFFAAVYFLTGGQKAGGHSSSPPAAGQDAAVLTATPPPTAEPTPTLPPTILEETADAGQAYIDKIVFIGNSITYRMASEYGLPYSQVWVPKSMTFSLNNVLITPINYHPEDETQEPEEMSIPEAAALRRPEYVVITMGTLDSAWMEEEQFKQMYAALIDSVREGSPDTKIICQSIFPVNARVVQEDVDNDEIRTANGWVLEVAETSGCRYLNTYEALVDDTGSIINEYAPWDGIHLTTAGYDAVFQYIRTHAWQ